jgi:hypothetical protein
LTPLLILLLATLIMAESGVSGRPALAIAGCVLGAGLLYAAARVDRGSRERLLPAPLLDVRHPVGAGLLMVFALSVGTTGFWAYGPLLLRILFGTDPLFSGYVLAGEALAWSVATLAVSAAPPSADRLLIRSGAGIVVLGAAGFAVALPAGSLSAITLCALLQGLGFGLFWPAVVHRLVRFAHGRDQGLAAAAPSTIQRIGYAVGTALSGVVANACGLAEGISFTAAKGAAFWVFAAFFPVLVIAMLGAWRFTQESAAAS